MFQGILIIVFKWNKDLSMTKKTWNKKYINNGFL